jgi:aminoglycoside phosphotransferase (APT) family kinase protein
VVVPRDHSGAPRFIHNDFSSEHIIISLTTGRLSGIIDWSGAALGDAAQDFAYILLWRGWAFAQRAIGAYALPVDAAFNERTIFFARIRALGWLADAIKRGGSTAPLLDTVRRTFISDDPVERTIQ